MNTKNFAGCFIVLLVMMSLFSGFVSADEDTAKIISVSLINQDPDPAIAGDTVEVRVGVENEGGIAAENLILEFTPEYPFQAVAGEDNTKEIGVLNAYQQNDNMKIIKFKVKVDKDASAGEHQLKESLLRR